MKLTEITNQEHQGSSLSSEFSTDEVLTDELWDDGIDENSLSSGKRKIEGVGSEEELAKRQKVEVLWQDKVEHVWFKLDGPGKESADRKERLKMSRGDSQKHSNSSLELIKDAADNSVKKRNPGVYCATKAYLKYRPLLENERGMNL